METPLWTFVMPNSSKIRPWKTLTTCSLQYSILHRHAHTCTHIDSSHHVPWTSSPGSSTADSLQLKMDDGTRYINVFYFRRVRHHKVHNGVSNQVIDIHYGTEDWEYPTYFLLRTLLVFKYVYHCYHVCYELNKLDTVSEVPT